MELETRVQELERRLYYMESVSKGMQIATQGYDGAEHLVLTDLTILGDIRRRTTSAITPSGVWTNMAGYNTFGAVRIAERFAYVMGSITGGAFADGTIIGAVPTALIPAANSTHPISCVPGVGNSPQVILASGTGNLTIYGVGGNAYLHMYFLYALD